MKEYPRPQGEEEFNQDNNAEYRAAKAKTDLERATHEDNLANFSDEYRHGGGKYNGDRSREATVLSGNPDAVFTHSKKDNARSRITHIGGIPKVNVDIPEGFAQPEMAEGEKHNDDSREQ